MNIHNGAVTDVLRISTAGTLIKVLDWDFSQDVLQFGGKVNLKEVSIKYDESMTDFNVFIQNSLVAILDADNAELPEFNADTGHYQGTEVVPIALAASSDSVFLRSLYGAAFERAADSTGLAYWEGRIEMGEVRKDVIVDFFVSDEYSTQHLENADFVQSLYHDLLGRSADLAGEVYWTEALDAGVDRAIVVGFFVNSTEFNAFF